MELIAVLVVLAILAGLASAQLGATRAKVDTRAALVRLVTVQGAIRGEASTGSFPSDLTSVAVTSVALTEGSTTDTDSVSVRRIDDVTALYGIYDGVGCTYLLDTIGGAERWGYQTGDSCDTATMDTSAVTGTASQPSGA